MIHFVRANIRGQGYTVLDSRTAGAPPALPRGFLQARERLDAFLDGPGEPVAVTFNHDGEGALVGYACRIDARDEFGRRGLIFVHAVLLDDERDLPRAVAAVLGLLAPAGIAWITQSCEAAAGGTLAPDAWIGQLEHRFVQSFERLGRVPRPRASAAERCGVGAIEHDFAGCSAMAWLYLARQQAGARPPWEVFDIRTAESARRTNVTRGGSETLQLSTLVLGLLTPEAAVPSREPLPLPALKVEHHWPQLRLPVPAAPAAPAAPPPAAPAAPPPPVEESLAAEAGVPAPLPSLPVDRKEPLLSLADLNLLRQTLAIVPTERLDRILQAGGAWSIKLTQGRALRRASEGLKALPQPEEKSLRRACAALVQALQDLIDEVAPATFLSSWLDAGTSGAGEAQRLEKLIKELIQRRGDLAEWEMRAANPQSLSPGMGRPAPPGPRWS